MKKNRLLFGVCAIVFIFPIMTHCTVDKRKQIEGVWKIERVFSTSTIENGRPIGDGWYDVTKTKSSLVEDHKFIFLNDGTLVDIRYSEYHHNDIANFGSWEINGDTLRINGTISSTYATVFPFGGILEKINSEEIVFVAPSNDVFQTKHKYFLKKYCD